MRVPKTRVNPNATPSILAQNLKMHSVSDYNTRRGKDDENKDMTAYHWEYLCTNEKLNLRVLPLVPTTLGFGNPCYSERLGKLYRISTKLVDKQSCLCHGQNLEMLGNTLHWKFAVTPLLFSVHLPRPPLTD